jgi:hypothetical protein
MVEVLVEEQCAVMAKAEMEDNEDAPQLLLDVCSKLFP